VSYEPHAFKGYWTMIVTGNGQQNQIREASFCENILPMQESGQLNFIKRPEGDYLEQSELGFEFC
jgi:hypothetical protein